MPYYRKESYTEVRMEVEFIYLTSYAAMAFETGKDDMELGTYTEAVNGSIVSRFYFNDGENYKIGRCDLSIIGERDNINEDIDRISLGRLRSRPSRDDNIERFIHGCIDVSRQFATNLLCNINKGDGINIVTSKFDLLSEEPQDLYLHSMGVQFLANKELVKFNRNAKEKSEELMYQIELLRKDQSLLLQKLGELNQTKQTRAKNNKNFLRYLFNI